MVTKFWENTGGNLSKKWAELLFSPAFFFWLGTILLATRANGWGGWEKVWGWLITGNSFEQAARLVGGLLLVYFSAFLISRFNRLVLRILEGYYPPFFGFFTDWLTGFQIRRAEKQEAQWQMLRRKEKGSTLSRAERQKLASLEVTLHYVPSVPEMMMPTTLGNILRTGETLPRRKYGLDAVVCWSHLWLVLPEAARSELAATRQRLNQLASWWSWGLLSFVWMYRLPWLGVFSLAWMWLAYRLMLPVARTYADWIETVFDLYRWDLYNHLHLPLPTTSADELQRGKRLTQLLWRGPVGESTTFVHPGK